MSFTVATFVVAFATIVLVMWLRPARLARLAPLILVAHGLLVLWLGWSAKLDTPAIVATTIALCIAIGLLELAALAAVATAPLDSIALVGAAGWAVGWALNAATMLWLFAFLLDLPRAGAMPDSGAASPFVYALGGIVLAFARVGIVEKPRRRLLRLLVALFGLLGLFSAFAEQRILQVASRDFDLAAIESSRLLRDATHAIWLFALAALLHYCERHKPADPVPRAKLVS